MSPTDHIKALADRFMKAGAEDLWNKHDGPIKSIPSVSWLKDRRRSVTGPPVDLRKLISEGRSLASNQNTVNLNGNSLKPRNYSVQSLRNYATNESSSKVENSWGRKFSKPLVPNIEGNGENSSFTRNDSGLMKNKLSGRKQGRFWRKGSSSSDDETESDSEDESKMSFQRDLKKTGSSAALGKYDTKIKKRVPLKSLEKEGDFAEQVELIRHELRKRNSIENEENGETEEESILSEKRYRLLIFIMDLVFYYTAILNYYTLLLS